MRIKFSIEDGSLRIIPEIPDIALARLEGRNGIGKSLAARLLELVAGEPPYVGLPLAWSSLVEQLGRVHIEIDDVAGHTIRISLDSSRWSATDQAAAVANPGRAFIDGVETDWTTLRSVMQVRRIAGDETLGETIGLALLQSATEVDRQRLAIAETTTAWSATWDELRLSAERPAHEARAVVKTLSELAGERAKLIEEGDIASKSAEAATATLAALRLLGRIDEAHPSREQYSTAWERRSHLADAIASAESALMNRRGPQHKGSQDDFERLTKLVRIRRDAHTRAQFDENGVLRALGLDRRPEVEAIDQLLAESRAELEQLQEKQRTQFSAGTIREVAGSVERTLRELPTDLHREVVAELDREVTVGELARGLERRRESLRDVPKSEMVLKIERDLRNIGVRIGLLQSLAEVMRVADRKEANLREAEDDLESFFEMSESERAEREALTDDLAEKRNLFVAATSDALLALLTLRTAAGLESISDNTHRMIESGVDEDLEDTASSNGELDQRLVSPAALNQEVDAVVDESLKSILELGVLHPRDEWRESLPELVDEASRKSREYWTRQQQSSEALVSNAAAQEDALASLRTMRSELARLVESLAADEKWDPLRSAASAWLAERESRMDELLVLAAGLRAEPDSAVMFEHEEVAFELAAVLRVLVDDLEEAASIVRDRWDLATAYIRRESHELAPRLVHHDVRTWQFSRLDESRLGRTLRMWVEGEVSDLLSQDVLRRELFENAADVEYDLEARSVVWRSAEGKRRRRPLEAFSSGEQVFAYTRAKLESLKSLVDRAEHVLIFLDEFGAFVARDRFGELMRYVQTDVLGTIAHQGVVMLPSSDSDAEFQLRKVSADFANADYVVESLIRHSEVG